MLARVGTCKCDCMPFIDRPALPVFPSGTNLKLHNISVTPRMVKKVIRNLDLSNASGLECISVVVQ